MILKASERGGGMQLAAHLLKDENDHVEVHEIRGFVSDHLKGAMKEAGAIALGTRCKKHLFSVSLNPPADENAGIAVFEKAVDRIEAANGLIGQPRIIVIHEKEGRRHAHAVWSRIDANTMTAKTMSHFKRKLQQVAKSLYLEHGWRMPRGFANGADRDPRNFSLAEWQQAKRLGSNPDLLQTITRECWAASDSKAAFAAALTARGLKLARGKRDYLVVAYDGRVHAIPRLLGLKTKAVRERLGDPNKLPSFETAKADLAAGIAPRLKELVREADSKRAHDLEPLHQRRTAMKERHGETRRNLDDTVRARSVAEVKARAARLRGGIMGVWDRLTGRHGRTVRINEAETRECVSRDRTERDGLVASQLQERRALQRDVASVRHRHAAVVRELHDDIREQSFGIDEGRTGLTDSFNERSQEPVRGKRSSRTILRGRTSQRDGPDFGR